MPETFLEKGQVFGSLTVIKHSGYTEPNKAGNRYKLYKCRCVCGRLTKVRVHKLRAGTTKSCGCLRSKVTAERNIKHNYSAHPAYNTWNGIINRCYNKNNPRYSDYGGRGIKVCKQWRGVNGCAYFCNWAMKNGFAENLQIERTNNDGNYTPVNCIFTTPETNSINRRNTVYVAHKGSVIPFREFYNKFSTGKITYNAAYLRLKKGLDKYVAIQPN